MTKADGSKAENKWDDPSRAGDPSRRAYASRSRQDDTETIRANPDRTSINVRFVPDFTLTTIHTIGIIGVRLIYQQERKYDRDH